jgi:hypothetical protein
MSMVRRFMFATLAQITSRSKRAARRGHA